MEDAVKNILVTGGFGFIGSHLLEQLLAEPDTQVHVVDNLSTAPLPVARLLEELKSPSNLSYDLEDVKQFCEGWDGKRFDEIYSFPLVIDAR